MKFQVLKDENGNDVIQRAKNDELIHHPQNAEIYNQETEASLQPLVAAVKAAGGVLQPLFVDEEGMIWAGHRRLAANVLAGYEDLPIIVKDFQGNDDTLLHLIISNSHRIKTPMEIYREAQKLKVIFKNQSKKGGRISKKLAEEFKLGSSRTFERLEYVAKNAPQVIIAKMEAGDLSIGAAAEQTKVIMDNKEIADLIVAKMQDGKDLGQAVRTSRREFQASLPPVTREDMLTDEELQRELSEKMVKGHDAGEKLRKEITNISLTAETENFGAQLIDGINNGHQSIENIQNGNRNYKVDLNTGSIEVSQKPELPEDDYQDPFITENQDQECDDTVSIPKYGAVLVFPDYTFAGGKAIWGDLSVSFEELKNSGRVPLWAAGDTQKILKLSVKEIVSENGICMLWASGTMISRAIKMLDLWGFSHMTTLAIHAPKSEPFEDLIIQEDTSFVLVACHRGKEPMPNEKIKSNHIGSSTKGIPMATTPAALIEFAQNFNDGPYLQVGGPELPEYVTEEEWTKVK